MSLKDELHEAAKIGEIKNNLKLTEALKVIEERLLHAARSGKYECDVWELFDRPRCLLPDMLSGVDAAIVHYLRQEGLTVSVVKRYANLDFYSQNDLEFFLRVSGW